MYARDAVEMVESQLRRPVAGRQPVAGDRILRAMEQVSRALFGSAHARQWAYADRALPIDCGQTISQPYVVAVMTAALHLARGDRVLEVGTGSGYQAAVLASIGADVYSIERHWRLLEQARAALATAGQQVALRHGDGCNGWPEAAPFQGILLACAADHVPPVLWSQLATGGRMVLPIGPDSETTWLECRTKHADGRAQIQRLFAVRFVPLVPGSVSGGN